MVTVKWADDGIGGQQPRVGYHGDAGVDLHCVGEHLLSPGQSVDVPIGIKIELPEGYWGRITARSSSLRRGLWVSEGVIDQGYRGPLYAYVTNRNGHDIKIEDGERVAQLILAPVVPVEFEKVEALAESHRGSNGFGSTGGFGESVKIPMGVESIGRVVRSDPVTVYLGGPIDMTRRDPDQRHSDFKDAMGSAAGRIAVWCPVCRWVGARSAHDAMVEDGSIIEKNLQACRTADWAVFEWNATDEPSLGMPIEIWERAKASKPTIVVGDLGYGLFNRYLQAHAVAVVQSWLEVATMVKALL